MSQGCGMGPGKDGVAVGCENCVFAGTAADDSFDVRVPITDQAGGFAGDARIRCQVSAQAHRLTLMSFQQAQATVPLSKQAGERIQSALDRIARHRICGNGHICPSEVVERCSHLSGADRDGCDPDA